MLEEFTPKQEQIVTPEREPDLSGSVVGIRIFKIGEFNPQSLEQFRKQVEMVKLFSKEIGRFIEKPPKVVIITNSDLSKSGLQILTDSNLDIVKADCSKTERRARLAKKITGGKSKSKGNFSYADMLNSLNENIELTGKETGVNIFTSSDLAGRPEILSRQLVGIKVIYDQWQKERPGQLAIVGSLITDVHNIFLAQEVVDGKENINLENLNKVFPNNALSLVPPYTHFSGITDNALAGEVEVGGKFESIGGNEDFLYGLKEMVYSSKDCCLLIEPFMDSGRQYEVKGVESKYERRQAVYNLYAQRLIEQAVKRGKIKLNSGNEELSATKIGTIIENIVDQHLFFAKVDQNNRPEIVLTKRQKLKSIRPPLTSKEIVPLEQNT